MDAYEETLLREKKQLLVKIEELKEEKKRLEETPIKETTTYGIKDDIRIDSDIGKLMNFGKTYGEIEVPAWKVKENINNRIIKIDEEIEELRRKVGLINDKLFRIEWEKPENVIKRQKAQQNESVKMQGEQLKKERLEHEETYKALSKLVEYLKIVGIYDSGLRYLANRLDELRFAFQKKKNEYIVDEIDLQSRENAFKTKTLTTKKEYREIKRSVIRLTKIATRNAKKYKELYELYLAAWEIVKDIERKGISKMQGDKLSEALKKYFTQPTSEYLHKDYRNNYSYKKAENLGYKYLEFYRNYDSKYNEAIRKQKI